MAETRKYRAGSRQARFRAENIGKMSENRIAWIRTVMGQMSIMRYMPGEEDEEMQELGPTIRLLIPRGRGKPITFNFTAMTEEELTVTREFFDLLFSMVEPIVKERDRVAQDAFSKGDDSFSRCYRGVPQFIVRERTLRANGQGVHDGPEDLLDGDLRGGDSEPDDLDGGVRGLGSELADGEQEESGSEDDWSETDGS